MLIETLKYILLFPFSFLYGVVTGIRNWLFDKKILSSTEFSLPIIGIGNLAVGGTGKTPHAEFVLSILQNEYKTALLSRGYKRQTSGFVLADEHCNSATIGDEPYQIFRKFPNITVAVDEKRVPGVQQLLTLEVDLQLIVLDDAFQHRRIKAGLSILLTEYAKPYTRDVMLPSGRLREWKRGSNRADVIIVTKCPDEIEDFSLIRQKLKLQEQQELYFSTYIYDEIVPAFPNEQEQQWTCQRLTETKANVLLLTAIVSPKLIVDYLKQYTDNVESLSFSDHYDFREKDFELIKQRFNQLPANKLIIVTEKDAARLVSNPQLPEELKLHIFALPIRVKILENKEEIFIKKLNDYVGTN